MVRSHILIALGVLVIATTALAKLDDGSDTSVGNCMAKKLKKCVNSPANRELLPDSLDKTILGALYSCISKLVNNLFSGNLKFPKPCCKLPVFNLICDGNRRVASSRMHQEDF